MTKFAFAMGTVSLLFALVPIWLSLRFNRYSRAKLAQPRSDYTPPAAVMIPCKGTDLEFETNILSVLRQDYPDYEVIFVTACENDPAYLELARIIDETHPDNVKLLVAGSSPKRAAKLTNLLHAAQHISDDREVYVHLDADIRLRPDFLRHLVAPLQRDAVGATTGFPWYLPRRGRVGSVLRSIWGAGALPLLIDNRHNLASGAANAMKAETYHRAGVARAMDGAVSDTFAVTHSVKQLGKLIEFVPQCLFITPDDFSLGETIHWTTRQTIISRIYGRKFWWTATITYGMVNSLLLLGFILLLAAIVTQQFALLAASLLILTPIPLQIVNAACLLDGVCRLLPEHAAELGRLRIKYLLLAPFGFVLIALNQIISVTTNEITWRGIRYRLVSPTQTIIVSNDA